MGQTKQRTFVFGDIHGCALELKLMLEHLPLIAGDQLIFLGDYIDRGEDSKGVIEEILRLKKTHDVVALKGNHEKMFLDFLQNKETPEANSFIFNGGGATLQNYVNDEGEYIIPSEHMAFLESLLPFYETKDCLFVHAGLPDVPISELYKYDYEATLLWVRRPFFESDYDWGKFIIHGHTTVEKCEVTPKRMNLDTGCAYGGRLSVLQLPEKKLYSIPKQFPIKQVYLKEMEGHKRKSVRFDGHIPIEVDYVNGALECVTINYSERGMLISCIEAPQTQLWKEGEAIKGRLMLDVKAPIVFEGVIRRVMEKGIGFLYGVELTKTPFDHDRAE